MKKNVKLFGLVPTMILVMLAAASGKAEVVRISDKSFFAFDDEKSGSIPDGWTNVSGKWIVKTDRQNKVLAQTAENKGNEFNVAVFAGTSLKDVELSVDIRANSGDEDRGGGLVWRYIDAGNYYIVRFAVIHGFPGLMHPGIMDDSLTDYFEVPVRK